MLIESVERPVRYRWPDGELLLEPGKPIAVATERGQRILAKCGSIVRMVEPNLQDQWPEIAQQARKAQSGVEDMWVEFQSPLFGICSGRVLSIGLECFVITEHSVLKEQVTVPT